MFDAEQGYPYLKRFTFEDSGKHQRYLGDNEASTLFVLSDKEAPMFELRFGGADASRPALIVDGEDFIGVKSFKARGKRLTTFELAEIVELEPKRPDTVADENEAEAPKAVLTEIEDDVSDEQVRDEFYGQERLFQDEEYENA